MLRQEDNCRMHRLGQFFSAIWDDWGSRMSGPATVPLGMLAFWVSIKAYKILWGILAFICALTTVFIVWLNERKKFEQEQQARLELTSVRQIKEEWARIEKMFEEYGGGSNCTMEAFWVRQKSTGIVQWDLLAGWDQGSRDRFKLVMDEAGQLLLTTRCFKFKYSQYADERDDTARWLFTLCSELGESMKPTGSGYTPKDGETESGAIRELPRKCALSCARFAAQEKIPADSVLNN